MLSILKDKLESQFSIPDGLWMEIESHAKQITLKKNEVLIPYSSRNRTANMIISGSFKKSYISPSGEQTAIWFFFEELFNVAVSFDSYILNEFTKYEVIALEDAIVYQFEKEKVDEWAERFKGFGKFYREDILKSFFMATEIRTQMISSTPKDLMAYLENYYPEMIEKVPSKYLAEFMGITPEWLSKIKRVSTNS